MISPAQVGVELGVAAPTSQQLEQWASWIDQARYLIGKRLDISAVDPDDVDYVVLQSVVAHARHPGSETQVTVSVDDASTSRSYARGVGRVTILEELWPLLDPTLGESSAGSTQLFGEPDWPLPDPWAGA